MRNLYVLMFTFSALSCLSQPTEAWLTPFEGSGEMETATHAEAITYYEKLAAIDSRVRLYNFGKSDVGRPIHLCVISGQEVFDPKDIEARGLPFLLINNAIHPGEPCGVDACMMLARDLLAQDSLAPWLDQVVIGIIPMYNVGGGLNRGCCSRANQNGPRMYGFRGNARNFDLNRDFIKADTRNARVFIRIFQRYLPELFVDTHTTNGADYEAVITLIQTLPDKLGSQTAAYQEAQLVPAMERHMKAKSVPMCPYVYSLGKTPDDKGIHYFLDLPRYSSGYAALFQTMSFITEAHMLKPFRERVWGTYTFLRGLIAYSARHGEEIVSVVAKDRAAQQEKTLYDIAWQLDTNRQDQFLFAGYKGIVEQSQVTKLPRLRYDQDQAYRKHIPLYKHYLPTKRITAPKGYIIPQGYDKVVNLLQENGVKLRALARDTVLEVEVYRIGDLHSYGAPYEGHFYHDEVEISPKTSLITCYAGDWVAYTNQQANPFLVHVLEPEASDSYFRWNYFDGILMQKEYFSPYLFEEKALELLEQDTKLAAEFYEKQATDSLFARNSYAQLLYIYKRSPFYEPSHRRYPILRYHGTSLPLSIIQDEGK